MCSILAACTYAYCKCASCVLTFNPLIGISGISHQHKYIGKKNRNLISHSPIFVIKKVYQYFKLYVDRRNVAKEKKFFNPVADYSKMASRLNSDKVVCRVLEDDYRLLEEESSEKGSDSILDFARKRL